MSAPPSIGLRRWRLALGRFAESNMPQALGAADQRMDRVLDEVYGRAYAARGIRRRSDRPKGKRGAGLEASQLTVIGWLREMRALFPASVYEAVQAHAIERFGMSEILKDPQALAAVEPNTNLLKALVAFKGQADAGMRETIRSVSRKVVEELMRRLKVEVERALSGARRRASTNRKSMADFDWRATVRANLKNWDGEPAPHCRAAQVHRPVPPPPAVDGNPVRRPIRLDARLGDLLRRDGRHPVVAAVRQGQACRVRHCGCRSLRPGG
jgi:hypothetical protein